MKLQISLEVLLSISIALMLAVCVLSYFAVAYHSYGNESKMQANHVCAAINFSSTVGNECTSCVSLIRSGC